jgi:hypothetical protein
VPSRDDELELIEGNAGDFYKKIGFIETGEKMGEEIVAEFRF